MKNKNSDPQQRIQLRALGRKKFTVGQIEKFGASPVAPRKTQPAEPSNEQPIIRFPNAAAFRRWLEKSHAAHPGIWMKIAKKGSGLKSVTYPEALDEALCFGWIDGQKKPFDEESWLQKFTRRGRRSRWSKINVSHVERLTRAGRMHAAGLAAVAAAKADGRWDEAYHSIRTAEAPADFLSALDMYPKARSFYESLNQSNRFAIYYRLMSAKRPDTRARRFAQILAMMKRGEKFH